MMDNLSDDFYRLFNDMYQRVEEYEEIPVASDELKNWKRNFRKNLGKSVFPVKKAVVAACAALIVGLLVGPFNSYTVAAIETVSYTLGEVLGFNDNISDYETMIGKTVSKDGYEITLNSAILDGDILYLTYTERFPERLGGAEWFKIDPPENEIVVMDAVANGTNHILSSGGTYRPVDDYTRLAVFDCNFEKPIDTSKPVKIKLRFDIYKDDSDKPATVIDDIAFVADGSQLALKSEEMALDYEYQFPDGSSVRFTGLETNPVSRKIFYEEKNTHDSGFMWELRMHDNLGNYIIETNCSSTEGEKNVLEGCLSYNAGEADTVDEAATEIICEVWGGYFTGAAGENVEGEYMEKIGEFEIPLD